MTSRERPESDAIDHVLAVYNADGGLVGEARYVVGHLLGRTECQLCDITHSPVRRKRAWAALVESFPVPIVTRHRNELTAYTQGVIDPTRLPAVYAVDRAGAVREVVSRAELASMDGSVDAFGALLLERVGGL